MRANRALFDGHDAEVARVTAPDLYQRAKALQNRAGQAMDRGDAATAEHWNTLARIYLLVAITEAKRISVEQERERVAAQVASIQGKIAALRAKRVAEQRRTRRAAVEKLVRERIAVAFEVADGLERRRPVDRKLLEQAFYSLKEHTLLVLAAARAMGVEEERVGKGETAVRAVSTKDLKGALLAMEGHHWEAQALMRDVRARLEQPSGAERQVLVATATRVGFSVDQTELGVLVSKDDFWAGRGLRITRPMGLWLERLKGLVAAHPFGTVQVRVTHEKLAVARARKRLLERHFDSEGIKRVSVERTVRWGADRHGALVAFFTGYPPMPTKSASSMRRR